MLLIASLGSLMSPSVPGYAITPQTSLSLILDKTSFSSPIITSKPKGSALVFIISIV